MKFIYATEVDISIDNGQGINEREFINALFKDHEQQVICITPCPKYPETYCDKRIEYVASHKRYNPFFYFLFLGSTFRKIMRLRSRHKLDAVVFRLGEIPIIPYLVSRVLGIPIILKTFAGYTLFEHKGRRWKLWFLSKLLFPLYKICAHCAIASDTVSPTYIEWLCFKFGIAKEKVHLIPNGANIEHFSPVNCKKNRFDPGLKQFDIIIGYVGALDPLRHVDKLVRAAKQVRSKSNKNIGFVVIGDGKEKCRLEELAEKEGVTEHFLFTGSVPYKDVPQYMNSFDIAVDLSLIPMRVNGKVQQASYSQKIAQYLSCGLPVVTWDIDGNGFIREESLGGLASACDLDSLVAEIKRLVNIDEKSRCELSRHAREYAEEHLCIGKLNKIRLDMWCSAVTNSSK